VITDLQKSQKMENQATWMVSETLLRKLDTNVTGEQAQNREYEDEEEEKEDMHRV